MRTARRAVGRGAWGPQPRTKASALEHPPLRPKATGKRHRALPACPPAAAAGSADRAGKGCSEAAKGSEKKLAAGTAGHGAA